MEQKTNDLSEMMREVAKCIFIGVIFFALDMTLRILTRWLGYYSIYELAPSLFSICWILLFIVGLSLLPRKAGRITYAVLFGVWATYCVCQYIYYLIFDKFFFLSDIRNATEGAGYLSYVSDVLNINTVYMVGGSLLLGVAGFLLFPNFEKIGTKLVRRFFRVAICIISCIAMLIIPKLYTHNEQALFFSSQYEYEQFTNSGFDVEISGIYHYVARDFWKSFLKPKENTKELHSQVESYLKTKHKTEENSMFGVLRGKNLILIQMESIDDWILTEENMPTVSQLMDEGICFTNMYTPLYGSGWTFSTEFAFNSGIYQSTSGVAAYSMSQNQFPYSLANILKSQGYSCMSFHQNTGNFYSRSSIHPALGYRKYISTSAIVTEEYLLDSDISMIEDDNVWKLITNDAPFLSFINTYGAHVPYSAEDPLVQWALCSHPEYNVEGRDPELNAIFAKARTLDDMFDALLRRLEEDGLLENTAIIAYTDHYCYGLTNKEIVHELSEANGSSILERTPAFVWYEGCQNMKIDKICQTIDWVPTIANMYGIDVTPYVMGYDIFDDLYAGYAIFPDGTWLSGDTYAVNGIPQYGTMIAEEIKEMNEQVNLFYQANEAILKSNYYASVY